VSREGRGETARLSADTVQSVKGRQHGRLSVRRAVALFSVIAAVLQQSYVLHCQQVLLQLRHLCSGENSSYTPTGVGLAPDRKGEHNAGTMTIITDRAGQ
jgi:hypothetical protein